MHEKSLKDYKTCRICGAFLDLTPILKRTLKKNNRSYEYTVIGEREAFFKSSEQDPTLDEACYADIKEKYYDKS